MRDRLIRLREHIEGIHSDKSFEGNLERLVKESEKKFWLKIPELLENSHSVSESEISMTKNNFGRNTSVKATRFTVTIPFTGDQDLFRYTPQKSETNKPEIEKIVDNSIIFIVEHDPVVPEVAEKIKKVIEKINLFLLWVKDTLDSVDSSDPLYLIRENNDVRGFNELVTATTKSETAKRQSQLKASKGVAQDIENLLNQN